MIIILSLLLVPFWQMVWGKVQAQYVLKDVKGLIFMETLSS